MSNREFVITPEVDLALLDALQQCIAPVGLEALTEIAWPRDNAHSVPLVRQWLTALESAGYVTRYIGVEGAPFTWAITDKGRAHWAACEARQVFRECAEHTPVRPAPKPDSFRITACDAADPHIPSTALLCVDEDELDEWWDNLDVGCKADAFAGFALRMHSGESHVYVEAGVPIIGTAGETAEEWAAKAKRVPQQEAQA